MSVEENKALIRRVLDMINDRELDGAFEFYATDYVYHGPGGQELRGRDQIRDLWGGFFGAFPDLHATIDDMFAEGDSVALRWTIAGTHTGDFQGIAPTGKRIELPIAELFRIVDGVLVEAWDQYDRLHLLEQIGAVPTPAEA